MGEPPTGGEGEALPGAQRGPGASSPATAAALDALLEEARPGTFEVLPRRLGRYATGNRYSRRMAGWLERQSLEPRRVLKLRQCAGFLHFRHYLEADRVALHGGYFCNQWKLCPTCAIKRGGKMLTVLVPKILRRLEENPRLRAYLVTWTTKDGPDCAERWNHLHACQRKYFERRNEARKWRAVWELGADGKRRRVRNAEGEPVKRRKAPPVEANKAEGIYWASEGGRGAGSGEWHWHTHSVWLCERAPWATRLSSEWHEITGDSFIVDVREMKFSKARDHSPEAVAADVVEVCKYTLKPHELTTADAYTVWRSTTADHFTGAVGALRFTAEELEELKADRDAGKHDGPHVDLFYRWTGRSRGWLGYEEQDRGGLSNRGYILAASREINRLGLKLDRTMRAASFAARGSATSPSLLDTRVISGGSDAPEDATGPPVDGPRRPGRFAAAPSDAEDLFA